MVLVLYCRSELRSDHNKNLIEIGKLKFSRFFEHLAEGTILIARRHKRTTPIG